MPAAPARLPDAGWAPFRSARFALEVRLPQREQWRVDDRSEPWLVATHGASTSSLLVRAWRAARLAKPDDCEAQARAWRKSIPEASPDSIVDEANAAVPEGYSTHVLVGVHPAADEPDAIDGYLLAFGATVRRCYALVFTTRGRGEGAEAEVGDRLGLVAGGILRTLRMRGVEDRGPQRVGR